MRKQKTENRER